jgi:hypothetical protein
VTVRPDYWIKNNKTTLNEYKIQEAATLDKYNESRWYLKEDPSQKVAFEPEQEQELWAC